MFSFTTSNPLSMTRCMRTCGRVYLASMTCCLVMWRLRDEQTYPAASSVFWISDVDRPQRDFDTKVFRNRVGSIHLLDTSSKMLDCARRRIQESGVEIETTCGTNHALARNGSFDLIITCSVLHHIPDLDTFCQE